METEKKKLGLHYYIEHIGTLFVITVVVALLLSFVNKITAPIIEAQAGDNLRETYQIVMPDADSFTEESYNGEQEIISLTSGYQGETLIGWCVQVAPVGYKGAVDTMVAVSVSGEVLAVRVVSHEETAGIGTEAVENEQWLGEFVGATLPVTVDSVSGATYSSRAVSEAVTVALTVVEEITGGAENG